MSTKVSKRAFYVFVFSLASIAFAKPIKLNLNQNVSGPYKTGYLTSDCTIDNKASECLIDTGALNSLLKYDEFKDYKTVGKAVLSSVHPKTQTIDLIKISNFQIGSISLGSHIFGRITVNMNSLGQNKNIIGNDIYWGNYLYFNFSNETLDINGEYPTLEDKFELISYKNRAIGMSISLGSEQAVEAFWDTGSAMTMVSKRFIKSNPSDFEFVGIVFVEDVLGTLVQAYILKTNFVIGGKVFENINVIEIDFSTIKKIDPNIDVVIGFNIYSKVNWLIDYDRLVWGIK